MIATTFTKLLMNRLGRMTDNAITASFFCPKFKDLSHASQPMNSAVMGQLRSQVPINNPPSQDNQNRSPLSDSEDDLVIDEIEEYLNHPSKEVDCLAFWKMHQHVFPRLFMLSSGTCVLLIESDLLISVIYCSMYAKSMSLFIDYS